MNRKSVLRSQISTGTYQEFINEILALVKDKVASYVCFANVHMVMEGFNGPDFQKTINNANIVAPDGRPVSLFLSLFNKTNQERVCGMDLFPDLLKKAAEAGKSVYFYGNTDEILLRIVRKARTDFPSLKISGFYSPPFRVISDDENDEIIDRIKKSSPDLVFVSLGCPKQEKWMAKNRDKIGACLLGVGQAFSTYAGVEKRLPVWMRNLSLEWIFRLYLEPKRLWKRYLFTNSYFLWLTLNYMLLQYSNKISGVFTKLKSTSRVFQETEE